MGLTPRAAAPRNRGLRLGDRQRSAVEVEIIEGWAEDPETEDMVPAIAAHYRATGSLLVGQPERMALAITDVANVFDADGERDMCEAAGRLASQCWKLARLS